MRSKFTNQQKLDRIQECRIDNVMGVHIKTKEQKSEFGLVACISGKHKGETKISFRGGKMLKILAVSDRRSCWGIFARVWRYHGLRNKNS